MNDLVFVRKCNKEEVPFTNSLNISKGSNLRHDFIKKTIKNHKDELMDLGKLSTRILSKVTGGRRNEVYEFNEPQAMFLITLLSNTDEVVKFKLNLVKQFTKMKEFIQHKQSQEYIQARKQSTISTKKMNERVKTLEEIAKEQGSTNHEKLYINYSRLANDILEIKGGQKDKLDAKTLVAHEYISNYIERRVNEEVGNNTHYKEIYQICKKELMQFKSLFV